MATSFNSRLGTAPEEAVKAPVKVVSTTNLVLTAEQTVEGVTVVAGDRVLVAAQTSAAENGVYQVSLGAWTRTKDFNASDDVVNGTLVLDTNTGNLYRLVLSGTWTPDTTSITFAAVDITGGLTGLAVGGVVFGDASGLSDQDALNFYWDALNNRLGVGTNVPAQSLDINGNAIIRGTFEATGSATLRGLNVDNNTITNLAAPVGANDAARKTYVDTADALKLNLSGGTMSGAIAMGTNQITGLGDPTLAQDAATKTYVDTADALKLPLAGGTMSGAIAMGTNKITGLGDPTLAQDAATKTYVDTADALKLPLAGGTMSGAIEMSTNKITGLGTPTVSTDAVTKAYADALTPTIPAGSIGQTEIGTGAVHQDELDTTLGEVSSNVSGTQKAAVVLPGGTHGFYPQIKFGGDPAVVLGTLIYNADANPHPSTYTTYISFNNNDTSSLLMYAQQRYVNASPPYNLGDGDVPIFVFIKMAGNNVVSVYSANVPPWAYNGPTNVSGKLKADGKKYQLKRSLDRDTGEIIVQEIEVTHAIKNADMALIPHPFTDMKPSEQVLMLDPVGTEALLDMSMAGESICELIHSDYIRFDNTPLNRATPAGVQAVDFTWRNTGAKPKGRKV